MPTSAPGNRTSRDGTACRHSLSAAGGFTLIEVMVVMAIIAIAVAVASLALRDPALDRLERDATRLAALLEMARAEARAAAQTVLWVPQRDGDEAQFRFVGLRASAEMPTRWLDARVQAQVVGGVSVRLGPEAILPAQRIVLSLDPHRVELSSDGLGAFAVVSGNASP